MGGKGKAKVKKELHDVTIVVDRSGSMSSRVADAIGGFHTFLEAQKKLPGECNLSVIQFDEIIETIYSGPVAGCASLTTKTYVPRGSTALLDAVGRAIAEAKGRPGAKTVVVITDGQENASKEWTWERLGAEMKELQDVFSSKQPAWDFVFLGCAHADWLKEQARIVQSLHVPVGRTYGGSGQSVSTSYNSASSYLSTKRAVGTVQVADVSWQAPEPDKPEESN